MIFFLNTQYMFHSVIVNKLNTWTLWENLIEWTALLIQVVPTFLSEKQLLVKTLNYIINSLIFKTFKYRLIEIGQQTRHLRSTRLLWLIECSSATWTELPGGQKPSRIRIIYVIAEGCGIFSEKVAEGHPYIYRYHTVPCVPSFTAFPCQLGKGKKPTQFH